MSAAPRIVAIGGGSGLSALLRGLKALPCQITAIVTVADDGGNSGMLRSDLGVLPPGDVRNCLVALSRAEPDLTALLQYRFTSGALADQCVGNLILTAMTDIAGGFLQSIRKLGAILNVAGQVLPVSLDSITLTARISDGSVITGESNIGLYQRISSGRIQSLSISPPDSRPLPEALEAIAAADMIILGPGSLFTSVLPNLLVGGVAQAIRASGALKVYVMNLMTQPGETQGLSAMGHLQALHEHAGAGLAEVVLFNDEYTLPQPLLTHYQQQGAQLLSAQCEAVRRMGLHAHSYPLLRVSGGAIRHSYSGTARALFDILHTYRL